MSEHLDAEDLVGRYWPLHGQYSPERTEAATHTVGELVRYLAYATGQGAERALPYAGSVYTVVGGLRAAVGGLEQTLRQLTARARALQDDPSLGHCDRRREPGELQAARAAAAAAGDSLTAAARAISALSEVLNTAQSQLGFLYHRRQGAGDG